MKEESSVVALREREREYKNGIIKLLILILEYLFPKK